MEKYTVISYNFNNYDKLREVNAVNTSIEYKLITDEDHCSKTWRIIKDKSLSKFSGIYSTYYVRYHPFLYANTDNVILIDASIKINTDFNDVIREFERSEEPIGLLQSRFLTDEDKLFYWLRERKGINETEFFSLSKWLVAIDQAMKFGSIGCGLMIIKRKMIPILEEVWNTLFMLSHDINSPIRTDEVVLNKILNKHKIKPFLIARQAIQTKYLQFYKHKTDEQAFYKCRDNTPTVYNNEIVEPFMPGEEFNREYTYNTEAMLLTKYLNSQDLKEWLDWHLNIVKFNHIHVFDNESSYDAESICKTYGDRVSYEKVSGRVRQYQLYDNYVNNVSKAEWIMPIDDDEYIYIDKFDSISEAIQYYKKKFPFSHKLAIRWKHLFPKKFHTECNGKVLDYCTESNPELAKQFISLGDGTVKAIVHRYGNIHYEETWENPAGGHIPTNGYSYGATLCDGKVVNGCGIKDCPEVLQDEHIRILHCRYKGYSEYKRKMQEVVTVSDATPRKKHFKFDDILETLE